MNLATLGLHSDLQSSAGVSADAFLTWARILPFAPVPTSPFCLPDIEADHQLLFTTVGAGGRAVAFFKTQPTPLICAPVSPRPSLYLWTLLLVADSSLVGDLGGGPTFLALSHSHATLLQVVSPLTESVLGETLLTVTEEKVSITQLQAQVVASLALSLRPSPGSSHTILATAAAQQTLSFLKQVTGCPTGQPRAWSVEGEPAGSGCGSPRLGL